MQNNRYIDFLKGIAILCVIYGHCLQYGSGSAFFQQELYWENTCMKAIYSFHMPLFIAISGYLFFFSLERSGAKICLMKRAKTLLPVCGTWAVILLVRDVAMGSRLNAIHTIARLVKYFLTDFWFLWAVLLCTGIVAITEELIHKKYGGGDLISLCGTVYHLLCDS